MRRNSRQGVTLVETIAATVVGAAMLVPMMSMIRNSISIDQGVRVRRAMIVQAETLVDSVRMAVAEPGVFASAAAGGVPSGIKPTDRLDLFPGERVEYQIQVRPHDANRDLIDVDVTVTHESSGMVASGDSVRLITQIARPW